MWSCAGLWPEAPKHGSVPDTDGLHPGVSVHPREFRVSRTCPLRRCPRVRRSSQLHANSTAQALEMAEEAGIDSELRGLHFG
jgi:hypothetical protein